MACRWRIEKLVLSTSLVGAPDRYACFDARNSRSFYPYPRLDRLLHRETEATYEAVILENDYLEVVILPQIGGRVHRARLKSTGQDFFFHNPQIRPALVALRGAWIAGGLEFNFPIGHHPLTFSPVAWRVEDGPEGSITAWVGATDRLCFLEWAVGLRIRPESCALEIEIRLANPTSHSRCYGFWSNAAVPASEGLAFLCPGEEGVIGGRSTPFLASGGADLHFASAHRQPIDLFALPSNRAWFGAYDFREDWGLIHIANPLECPGKKFFTWGTQGEGVLWRELLNGGPESYCEIQSGRTLDQSSFRTLAPRTQAAWTEHWIPVSGTGGCGAVVDGVIANLTLIPRDTIFPPSAPWLPARDQVSAVTSGRDASERFRQIGGQGIGGSSFSEVEAADLRVNLYAWEESGTIRLTLESSTGKFWSAETALGPGERWEGTVAAPGSGPYFLQVNVGRESAQCVVGIGDAPPQSAALTAEREVNTSKPNEEPARRQHLNAASGPGCRFLSNLRQERQSALSNLQSGQGRRAALLSLAWSDYWLGRSAEALERLRQVGGRLSSETRLIRAELLVEQWDEAGAVSSWRSMSTGASGAAAVLRLAALAMRSGDQAGATALFEDAARLAPGCYRARCGLAILHFREGRRREGEAATRRLLAEAPLDPVVRWIETQFGPWPWVPARQETWNPAVEEAITSPIPDGGGPSRSEGGWSDGKEESSIPPALSPALEWLIDAGVALADLGLEECAPVLEQAARHGVALAAYHRAFWDFRKGDNSAALDWVRRAISLPADFVFPYRDSDRTALLAARQLEPNAALTHYYLGLWYLGRGNLADARTCLEHAFEIDGELGDYPPLLRALARCLWDGDAIAIEPAETPDLEEFAAAELLLERAIENAPLDLTLYLERDLLAERAGEPPSSRLLRLKAAPSEVRTASPIVVRTAALLVRTEDFSGAIRVLNTSTVDPKEGGPGARRWYADARLGRALALLAAGDLEAALEDLEAGLEYPAHLGDAIPSRPAHAELLWWAGLCSSRMGRTFQAQGYWQAALATDPSQNPVLAACRNLAIQALGGANQARAEFQELLAATESLAPGGARGAPNPGELGSLQEELGRAAAENLLARALALEALGEGKGAQDLLEWLQAAAPEFGRARWYRKAMRSGPLV